MAFDISAQKSFTIPGGGRGEAGWYDISADSWTVEVPTRLLSCYYGHGISIDDPSGTNTAVTFTTDCSVSSSSAITFRRSGPYNGDDVRFSYLVFGW